MNISPYQLLNLIEGGGAATSLRMVYVDIAGGDINAGLLLTQIAYWNKPDKGGNDTKLRVEKNGRLWLAKKRTDWYAEIRLTEKQYDRAIRILQDLGIVEVQLFKFNGHPIPHIWLNIDTLYHLVGQIQYGKDGLPILPKQENGLSPNGKMSFTQTVKSLTETTTESTTETTDLGLCPTPPDVKKELKPGKEDFKIGVEKMATVKEVLENKQIKKSENLATPKLAAKKSDLYLRWKQQAAQYHGGKAKELTGKDEGQLNHVFKAVGADSIRLIDFVWGHWKKFANKVAENKGIALIPGEPSLPYFCTHYDVAWQLIAKADAAQQPVKKLQPAIDKQGKVNDTPGIKEKPYIPSPEELAALSESLKKPGVEI